MPSATPVEVICCQFALFSLIRAQESGVGGSDGLGDAFQMQPHGIGCPIRVMAADSIDDCQVLGKGNARPPWLPGQLELETHSLSAQPPDGGGSSMLRAD